MGQPAAIPRSTAILFSVRCRLAAMSKTKCGHSGQTYVDELSKQMPAIQRRSQDLIRCGEGSCLPSFRAVSYCTLAVLHPYCSEGAVR